MSLDQQDHDMLREVLANIAYASDRAAAALGGEESSSRFTVTTVLARIAYALELSHVASLAGLVRTCTACGSLLAPPDKPCPACWSAP